MHSGHDLSNEWLVAEMRDRFVEDPRSVSEAWRRFFSGEEVPAEPAATTEPLPLPAESRPEPSSAPAPPPPAAAPESDTPEPAPDDDGADVERMIGAPARIVEAMETSREIPTATSVRSIPARLLEVNRAVINNQLKRLDDPRKVSFTHVIGWAVVRALAERSAMNTAYREIGGDPHAVRYRHVNLGLAMDMPARDGGRTLLVPNIKAAEEMDFRGFWEAYEEMVGRVRAGRITPDDFAGTTATLTNPGTVGTVQSVPRLMVGQGVIIGVGAIGYPPEYQGADPAYLARSGTGRSITMTSTYDHRVIQGAESGLFLARIHQLLLGEDGFYDEVFSSMGIPYLPARWAIDRHPPPGSNEWAEKQARVFQLINMFRVRGHLIADLDPLRLGGPTVHSELDPLTYGLTIWDLDRTFATGGFGGEQSSTLGKILARLRDAYCRTIGIEYMHIQIPEQKNWIQQAAEADPEELTRAEKQRILSKLAEAETFERFVHTKYLGHKRFSLEGSETLIPMLDSLLTKAAGAGMHEVSIGMAHRGRLNVLVNVIGKPFARVFREFEGEVDPRTLYGSGDVKYHVGEEGVHEAPDGTRVTVEVVSNPSHLEAVDPVLEGIVRAKQDALGPGAEDLILPVLIHGDAAFAGQGVVAETLNLSQLEGYSTGGTVHIVVNNQVGFTTDAADARSSFYATDIAKAIQAPIFHVNGDDPEAAVRVIRLAFAYRQAFHRDIVIDLVCYRRLGHNEGDDPSLTQPSMYRAIDEHPPLTKVYGSRLVGREEMTDADVAGIEGHIRSRLDAALAETRERPAVLEFDAAPAPAPAPVDTTVPAAALTDLEAQLAAIPDGFTVHPRLAKVLADRSELFASGWVDWALGEALAFASLAEDGIRVRLAGEDSRRGTFSHRHAVLVDHRTEEEHSPIETLETADAQVQLVDSLLSEFAAMGFEYGYSVVAPDALVMWEAQFGDFVNGAQVIIDQFLSAGEDKWGQPSSLVLLLPHGFEGQGPEHSSARIERFLQLSAEDNWRVVVPSTPGQYFHALRRQVLDPVRKPLVMFTPKSLLRTRASYSPAPELSSGGFHAVLPDPAPAAQIHRAVLCSGKLYYDLLRARPEGSDVALIRVEQLYPFPVEEIAAVLPDDSEVVWAQEEPANMGAAAFVEHHLTAAGRPPTVISREESASPATGSAAVHAEEQAELIRQVYATRDQRSEV